MADKDFRRKLEHLLNSESMENGSNTPDFILADFLWGCLRALDAAVARRDEWYGVKLVPGDSHFPEIEEKLRIFAKSVLTVIGSTGEVNPDMVRWLREKATEIVNVMEGRPATPPTGAGPVVLDGKPEDVIAARFDRFAKAVLVATNNDGSMVAPEMGKELRRLAIDIRDELGLNVADACSGCHGCPVGHPGEQGPPSQPTPDESKGLTPGEASEPAYDPAKQIPGYFEKPENQRQGTPPVEPPDAPHTAPEREDVAG